MFIYPSQPLKLTDIGSSFISGLSKSGKWIAEPKYNGSRCIIVTDKRGVPEFWGRNGRKLVGCHYDIILPPDSIFDSEWMMTRMKGIDYKDFFIVFDVYRLNGIDITDSLYERKKILENTGITKDSRIRLIDYHVGTDESVFKKLYDRFIERLELEGVVLKRLDQAPVLHRLKQLENNGWIKIRQPDMFYRHKQQG